MQKKDHVCVLGIQQYQKTLIFHKSCVFCSDIINLFDDICAAVTHCHLLSSGKTTY